MTGAHVIIILNISIRGNYIIIDCNAITIIILTNESFNRVIHVTIRSNRPHGNKTFIIIVIRVPTPQTTIIHFFYFYR